MNLKRVNKKVNPKELLKKSYTDTIHEDLEEKGVNFFQPESTLDIDNDFLSLPKDITEIPAKNLGQYLNAYTQQKMYMRTLIGWSSCMIEEARREYMLVASDLYNEASATKMSEKAKDTLINNNEKVLPLYNNLQDLRMKKNILELNLLSIEDAIFLISREISRRESDFNNEGRNYTVSKK